LRFLAPTLLECAAMKRRTLLQVVPLSVLLPTDIAAAIRQTFLPTHDENSNPENSEGNAMADSGKVYELRIYHALPGKLDTLIARFRDHTDKLFAKHGLKSVAYWTALDEPVKSSTFFYILEHSSREAATANWKSFQDDPEWKTVKAKSEENGKLVEKIDSTFLALADFSRQP
jgi:hypothetical protein